MNEKHEHVRDDDCALPVVELELEDGYVAVTAISADGHVWPWLMAPVEESAHIDLWPAHELVGPLPVEFVIRLGLDRACGHPRAANGTPCKIRLRPGERCRFHPADEDADR